jgi:hypothetical protein
MPARRSHPKGRSEAKERRSRLKAFRRRGPNEGPRQNRSTHGRSSTSSDQALRG